MGGTNILEPLAEAILILSHLIKDNRIFLLTDGQVSDREHVIELANTKQDNIRIHTFGIGSGCDSEMVRKIANMGRGSCSLVDDDINNLNGLVVAALAQASEPSLKACKIIFGDETTELGEIFRS